VGDFEPMVRPQLRQLPFSRQMLAADRRGELATNHYADRSLGHRQLVGEQAHQHWLSQLPGRLRVTGRIISARAKVALRTRSNDHSRRPVVVIDLG
jgi:hypothetical protein